MTTQKRVIFFLALVAIIVASFRIYSSRFYPALNSDDALNILMAHDYSLPENIYCWGQDRGGTLIPLVSQLFISLGCSPVDAVSLSNYLILILGFIGFSSLIKSPFYKIVFAVAWFLPSQRFVDINRFPLGVEYSLIGFAIWLINMFRKTKNTFERHTLLVSIVVVLMASIWVSDMAVVSIVVLLCVLVAFRWKEMKKFTIDKLTWSYAFAGIISSILFIRFAKADAPIKKSNYLDLNNLEGVGTFFSSLGKSIGDILTFSRGDYVVGVYAWLTFAFIAWLIIYLIVNKNIKPLLENRWFVFFAFDMLTVIAVLAVSAWVQYNGVGRWYFVPTYITLLMMITMVLDSCVNNSKCLKSIVMTIVLVGAVSPIYSMKTVFPKTLQPRYELSAEFEQLGKAGLIAEYWNAYINMCANPDSIVVTPRENNSPRNLKLVDEVFDCEKIYVVSDMWFETFPDTLVQFDRTLSRCGNEFRLGNCNLCQYTLVK